MVGRVCRQTTAPYFRIITSASESPLRAGAFADTRTLLMLFFWVTRQPRAWRTGGLRRLWLPQGRRVARCADAPNINSFRVSCKEEACSRTRTGAPALRTRAPRGLSPLRHDCMVSAWVRFKETTQIPPGRRPPVMMFCPLR